MEAALVHPTLEAVVRITTEAALAHIPITTEAVGLFITEAVVPIITEAALARIPITTEAVGLALTTAVLALTIVEPAVVLD